VVGSSREGVVCAPEVEVVKMFLLGHGLHLFLYLVYRRNLESVDPKHAAIPNYPQQVSLYFWNTMRASISFHA